MISKVLIAIACLGYAVNGQVLNIGSCLTLNNNNTECQNGAKQLPTGDYPGGINYGSIVNLFTDINAIKTACKTANRQLYRDAVVCITNSYRHCGDNDFKTLIPTAEKHAEAFDYVCNNEATADHILNCLSSSFGDCTANKLAREGLTTAPTDRGFEFSKYVEYNCGQIRVQDECVANDIDVQQCMDASAYEVYVQMRSILKPEACGASAIFITSSLLIISLIASLFQ